MLIVFIVIFVILSLLLRAKAEKRATPLQKPSKITLLKDPTPLTLNRESSVPTEMLASTLHTAGCCGLTTSSLSLSHDVCTLFHDDDSL